MADKKIVYLFGAGATHAEIINSSSEADAVYRDKNGLLISNLSKRVMRAAQRTQWFKRNENIFTSAKGSLNIELLISLFESNQIDSKYSKKLKELVQIDIKRSLEDNRKKSFYLHKALFELHKLIEDKEELLGIISLNYDDVLDGAYKEILKYEPNYYLYSKEDQSLPLLKLHGSFNWDNIEVYGKFKSIPIMPIGVNKNYLFPPYNFIWGKAYELLVKCDILRIIGCSLSQSDIGLIDLLFKAHLERDKHIKMEIIDFQPQNSHHQIKSSYGFFPGIIEPKDIEDTLIADETIFNYDVGNPFKIWLKAKAERMLDQKIQETEYIRKCYS